MMTRSCRIVVSQRPWQIGTVRSVSWQIAFISPRMHVQRQSAEAGAGSASRARACCRVA